MKKKQRKALIAEIKTLSEKKKIKMILYLTDHIRFLRLASNMQTELIQTMVDSKKAAAMGETFQ